MNKKLSVLTVIGLGALMAVNIHPALAEKSARLLAVRAGADRVVELQRTDPSWEGTWYWYVGSNNDATNLTGVTALGLLEAFRDVRDPVYKEASKNAADFILEHLGLSATGTQHHMRCTAPDVVFLHKLSKFTHYPYYRYRATVEWYNLTTFWPTAGDLDALFRSIDRRSVWDIAFYLEAAHFSGDTVWADGAAEILADYDDTFYYGTDTWWYALNIAGAIRALVGCGYYNEYRNEVTYFLNELIGLIDKENGINESIQDTAYAVLAFRTVRRPMQKYGHTLACWLARQQVESGGWLEGGSEYPEVNGEAVRALASTIGCNITLKGSKTALAMKALREGMQSREIAFPFNGDGR